MKKLFTLLCAALTFTSSNAQISITSNAFTYSEDFNTLSSTATSAAPSMVLPTGWSILEKGGSSSVNQAYRSDAGASNAGDMYSMGAVGGTDRGLGSLRSGTLSPLFGVGFINNSSASITSMNITYLGETWRVARNTSIPDTVFCEYAIGATGIDTVNGTWVRVAELTYINPLPTATSLVNVSAPVTSATVMHTLASINVAAGATIYFRFVDGNPSGADDIIGIDDFQMSMIAIPVEMVKFTAKKVGTTNKLAWQTATELNNQHFDVQRSNDAAAFQTIGQVKGAGNSVKVNNYTFVDETPSVGTNYYRLQQVDDNGKTTTSKTVAVNTTGKGSLKVFPTLATDKLNVLTTSDKEEVFTITNLLGQTVLTGKMVNSLDINISQLAKGNYILNIAGDAVQFSKQ